MLPASQGRQRQRARAVKTCACTMQESAAGERAAEQPGGSRQGGSKQAKEACSSCTRVGSHAPRSRAHRPRRRAKAACSQHSSGPLLFVAATVGAARRRALDGGGSRLLGRRLLLVHLAQRLFDRRVDAGLAGAVLCLRQVAHRGTAREVGARQGVGAAAAAAAAAAPASRASPARTRARAVPPCGTAPNPRQPLLQRARNHLQAGPVAARDCAAKPASCAPHTHSPLARRSTPTLKQQGNTTRASCPQRGSISAMVQDRAAAESGGWEGRGRGGRRAARRGQRGAVARADATTRDD
jgi:hypothetical protein